MDIAAGGIFCAGALDVDWLPVVAVAVIGCRPVRVVAWSVLGPGFGCPVVSWLPFVPVVAPWTRSLISREVPGHLAVGWHSLVFVGFGLRDWLDWAFLLHLGDVFG